MQQLVDAMGSLTFPADHAPLALRVGVAAVGLVLATAGARLERDGLRLAVLVAGALATVAAVEQADLGPRYHQPFAYAGLVLVGAGVAMWVERIGFRLGLALVGLVAGAATGVALCDAFGDTATPWFAGVGGILAGAVFPWTYEAAPRWTSPAVGAVGLAWGLGAPSSLPLVVGVWGLGVSVQLFTGPAGLDLREEPASRR